MGNEDLRKMNLTQRMSEKLSSMSKGQKKIVNYITMHYSKAVFMTAAKLGKEVGVSESTVVRFATLLGYKGYPEFQKALEGMKQLNESDMLILLSVINRMLT